MSILTPETGSPAAQALMLAGRMDGVMVDLKIVPTSDGLYCVHVSDPDFTGFYEKILPKSRSYGAHFDDESYFIYDDWTHERQFFEDERVEEPVNKHEVNSVRDEPGEWVPKEDVVEARSSIDIPERPRRTFFQMLRDLFFG